MCGTPILGLQVIIKHTSKLMWGQFLHHLVGFASLAIHVAFLNNMSKFGGPTSDSIHPQITIKDIDTVFLEFKYEKVSPILIGLAWIQ